MEKFTFFRLSGKLVHACSLIALFLIFSLNSSFDKRPLNLELAITNTDTDKDGIPNANDIDDDGDGIIDSSEDKNLDKDENPATNPTDSDGDGIPDYLDIDSDNDGILDNVESQTSTGYVAPCGIDSDGNGLDDHYEVTPGSCGGLTPIDTDGDTIPDYVDIDSDNDGILDNVEAQTSSDFQPPCGMDADGNGLDDHYENTPGSGEGLTPIDNDGDDHPDFRDLDSDNDGILDNVEAQPTDTYQAPCGMDSDGNGLDDHYENTPGSGEGLTPVDTDNDDTPDFRDTDSDNDGCYDTMEAGFVDAFLIGDRDGHLGNTMPPSTDNNGLVTSGENGEGYVWPVDSDHSNVLDFRENSYSGACDLEVIDVKDDTVATPKNTEVDIDVLDNDSGIPSDGTLTVTQPDNGTVVVNDNGTPDDIADDTVTYTPDVDFIGTDTFEYTVCDTMGNCDTATVTVECGLPLVDVVDDQAVTPEDTAVDIDVLANDAGIPSDGTLAVTQPVNGSIVVNDNGTPNDISDDTVTYTPNAGFNGTDTFEYTVCDAMGTCDTATVTVTVGTPVALDVVDDQAVTPEDTAVDIDVLANDAGIPSDGTLAVTQPVNGSIVVNDNGTPNDISDDTVAYTPNAGFNGTDTFEYTVCDAMGTCDTATVTVTVGTPVALDVVDDQAVTPEDTAVDIDVLANDAGIPSDGTLAVTQPDNGSIVVNDNGTPNDISDDTINYTPNAGFNGTDTFEYTVCDAMGTCDTATVTVTVGTPVALDVVDDQAVTPEDTAVDIDVLANDSGIPSDGTLAVTQPDNGSIVVNDNGTPNDISDDTINYTPNAGFNGTDTFEYTVCDAMGTCDTATVTVTVGTPVALDVVDDQAVTPEDTAVDIDVLANDSGIPSDGTLAVTQPDNGSIVVNDNGTPNDISDDTVTYTPNAGFNGTDTFEYTVCDAMGTCDTATVTVTVGTPVALDVVDDQAVTPEDTAVDIDVLANDAGIPSDGTLAVTQPDNGSIVVNDNGTPNDISDNTVTYTPNDGFNGTDTFEYTVCDAMGACDTATVTIIVGTMITIDAVDDDYTANPIDGLVGGVVEGSNVYDNDTLNGEPFDPEDVVLSSVPTEVLSINEDGSIVVAPNTADGTYTIAYTICDILNTDNCDTATVTIRVEESDEAILVNQLVTPNLDGRNDFLFIRGVKNAKNNSLKIFNRWGVAVYEGTGYNNQNNVFDGRSKGRSTVSSGEYLPAGVYFYIFDYQKGQENITDSGYIYVSN